MADSLREALLIAKSKDNPKDAATLAALTDLRASSANYREWLNARVASWEEYGRRRPDDVYARGMYEAYINALGQFEEVMRG